MNNSSFKFLDPYTKEDINSFFGRDDESKDIFDMCAKSNLLLVYGASGTGKTSMVQCGLAKEFNGILRKEIIVRRNYNIIKSLDLELKRARAKINYPGLYEEQNLCKAIIQLHRISFTQIYLIFDQFEELFIIKQGTDSEWKEEKEFFFQLIKDITSHEMFSACHVILVIREEFIAHLWEFEKVLPTLFQYRYRIEGMRKDRLKEVVKNILNSADISFDVNLPEEIVNNLEFSRGQIELTYLQVLLEYLRKKAKISEDDGKLQISLSHLHELGGLSDIIGYFIDDELIKLQEKFLIERRGLPIKLLGALVSNERTKKVLSEVELEVARKKIGMNEDEYKICINTFKKMKIIRQFQD